MGYGSDTWNANVLAKAQKNGDYVAYDNNGFAHRSSSESGLKNILNSYNSAIDYSVVNSFKNTLNENILNSAMSIAQQNNAQYQQYYNQSNEFNSAEAQKNRDWQEEMSNTAHQREVEDLKKAGLNPVLSANAGAPVTSGATASSATGQVDTSVASSLASIYNSMINSSTSLKIAKMNNDVQRYIANVQVSNARDVANIQAAASMFGASTSAAASRYATDIGITKSPLSLAVNNVSTIGSVLSKMLNNVQSTISSAEKQIYNMDKATRQKYGVKILSGKSVRRMQMLNNKL